MALVGIVGAACGHAPALAEREPFADAPPQTVSRDELRRQIGVGGAAVAGIRGKLDLALRRSADAGYRTCRGALAARSPWSGEGSAGIYLHGYRSPLPALFTLVSDGRSFWLHVPQDEVVYTGPVARRGGGVDRGGTHGPWLDARDLFRALFVEPIAPLDDMDVEEDPATYVVTVVHEHRPLRRIWVERRGLVVRREAFLDPAGHPEVIIDRDRYVARSGRLYPRRIVLSEPATGSAVRLEFDSLALDPPDLKADAFRPLAPPGARIERVSGEGQRT